MSIKTSCGLTRSWPLGNVQSKQIIQLTDWLKVINMAVMCLLHLTIKNHVLLFNKIVRISMSWGWTMEMFSELDSRHCLWTIIVSVQSAVMNAKVSFWPWLSQDGIVRRLVGRSSTLVQSRITAIWWMVTHCDAWMAMESTSADQNLNLSITLVYCQVLIDWTPISLSSTYV